MNADAAGAMRRSPISLPRMSIRRLRWAIPYVALACRAAAPPPAPAPVPSAKPPVVATRRPTPLPPIPLVEGPLAIKVVYPGEGAAIAARDSNYILGSVGNGRASLRINDTPVTVFPNGSFLAWLPVPPRTTSAY